MPRPGVRPCHPAAAMRASPAGHPAQGPPCRAHPRLPGHPPRHPRGPQLDQGDTHLVAGPGRAAAPSLGAELGAPQQGSGLSSPFRPPPSSSSRPARPAAPPRTPHAPARPRCTAPEPSLERAALPGPKAHPVGDSLQPPKGGPHTPRALLSRCGRLLSLPSRSLIPRSMLLHPKNAPGSPLLAARQNAHPTLIW